MKKLLLTIAFLTAINAYAQDAIQGNPDGNRKNFDPVLRATKMADRMKSELNLNDQQYAAVLKLNTDKASERAAEFKAMRDKREAERNSYKEELKKVLTADQYKAFEDKMAARKAKFEARMQHRMHKMDKEG